MDLGKRVGKIKNIDILSLRCDIIPTLFDLIG